MKAKISFGIAFVTAMVMSGIADAQVATAPVSASFGPTCGVVNVIKAPVEKLVNSWLGAAVFIGVALAFIIIGFLLLGGVLTKKRGKHAETVGIIIGLLLILTVLGGILTALGIKTC